MIQANILQFEIITKEKIALCSQVSLKYVTKKGDDLIGHPLGEPMEGIEPTTPRLQITCSGQLSYIGNSAPLL